jgi:hypothetical protein
MEFCNVYQMKPYSAKCSHKIAADVSILALQTILHNRRVFLGHKNNTLVDSKD